MTRLLTCHPEASLQMVRALGQAFNRLEPLGAFRSHQSMRHISRTTPAFIRTFYDVLDIPPDSSQADIKSAYYHLSMKYHPDRHNNEEGAVKTFREVVEAYDVLGNEKSREIYDRGLELVGPEVIYKPAKEDLQTKVKVEENDPVARFYQRHMRRSEIPIHNKEPMSRMDGLNKDSYQEMLDKKKDQKEYRKRQQQDAEHEQGDHSMVMFTVVALFAFGGAVVYTRFF